MKPIKLNLLLFLVVLLFASSSTLLADWDPNDGHKMHFPQMPDPQGWDICLMDQSVADDFMCSETGNITDIHFWTSWMYDDQDWTQTTFDISIWSNDPNGPCGAGKPGVTLWNWNGQGNVQIAGPWTGDEGWYCPSMGITNPHDHTMYWQVNITDINNPFPQEQGQTYWLVIKAIRPYWPPSIGWKTSTSRFLSCSLWLNPTGDWEPIEPEGMNVDQAFVITGEPNEPEPGKPLISLSKWSQPPIEIDPSPTITPPTYCGWDEQSTNTSEHPTPWKIVADDYHCIGSMPVTSIHWWGSYIGWDEQEPPPTIEHPEVWLIGFWTNVPAGVDVPYSHPDQLLWKVTIPDSRVTKEYVGEDYYPPDPNQTLLPESCFQYNLDLTYPERFHQVKYLDQTTNDIYWVSITALYPDGTVPLFPWGWKTRPWHWMDDAVTFPLSEEPMPGDTLDPLSIIPIEEPIEQQSMDVAFELDTDPNWVKWEQHYTGLRHWLHYEDEFSMATGTLPQIQRLVADDWPCQDEKPVTAIVWWGSYINYSYEACRFDVTTIKPNKPDYFLLNIWTDVPQDPNNNPYSHPNDIVWEYRAYDYDEVLVGYDKKPHGDPNEPVFRYSVKLPQSEWFHQDAGENVYWLSVVAVYDVNDPIYPWGWTNHEHVYSDDAVAGIPIGEPPVWEWTELYDQTGASEDMSFIIFTGPDCFPIWYSTYPDWGTLGNPNCWCGIYGSPQWPFQCDGDADNATQTFSKFRIYTNDLNLVLSNWRKKAGDATLNACADIDHKPQTFSKFRVYTNDLNIVLGNWRKKDDALPDTCPRPE